MKVVRYVSEMIFGLTNSLRSTWRITSSAWFSRTPAFDKTVVDYDMARQLYRNDGADSNLGAGFCKPIIDRAVEFIGLPQVSSDDEQVDADINRTIDVHWRPQLLEMFRNSMRDSKTYVRIYSPSVDDPLTTEDERVAGVLSLVDPERVTVIYDPRNPRRMQQAIIVNKVPFLDDVQATVDARRGAMPQTKEHEVWEIITPERYTYYDKTDNKYLDDWAHDNPDKFVPMVEVFNEYDSTLSGGQSDLESSVPFIRAFHEVLRQTLQAHSYHSVPKLKFKTSDIVAFLTNNFPDTIDSETGQPVPGATIKWRGREVLMLGPDDDLEFVEMTNIIGDSKTLLEFLIDCISIASETPEWAFMRVEGGTSQGSLNAQTIPFEKKIERKRSMFQEPIQMLIKMRMVMASETPERVQLIWPEIRAETLRDLAQAAQQLVMTLEVLLERELISDNTAREAISMLRLFRKMKAPEQEAKDAKTNLKIEMVAAAGKTTPPSARAIPQFTGSGSTSTQNGNGKVKVGAG